VEWASLVDSVAGTVLSRLVADTYSMIGVAEGNDIYLRSFALL